MPRPFRGAHICGRDIPTGAYIVRIFSRGGGPPSINESRTCQDRGGKETYAARGGKRVDNRSISMRRDILYAAGRAINEPYIMLDRAQREQRTCSQGRIALVVRLTRAAKLVKSICASRRP